MSILTGRISLHTDTMKRRVARFTRSIRASLGLTPKIGHGPAELPFRRETPSGRGTRNRVDALEVDLERLVRGWDQHVPRLLATVADVRADVFEATELQARVKRLEETLARLEAEAGSSAPASAGRDASAGKRPD